MDLPSVTFCDHEHEEDAVVDLIDNPVVTGPHSPLAVATDEFLGAAGQESIPWDQVKADLGLA